MLLMGTIVLLLLLLRLLLLLHLYIELQTSTSTSTQVAHVLVAGAAIHQMCWWTVGFV